MFRIGYHEGFMRIIKIAKTYEGIKRDVLNKDKNMQYCLQGLWMATKWGFYRMLCSRVSSLLISSQLFDNILMRVILGSETTLHSVSR